MLKNKKYQYGCPNMQLPVNLNFGEFILNKLIEYKDRTIINGKTHESITYGQIAQQAMNVAVSLYRLGVRKGHTIAICSENRTEFWSAAVGSICTGAVFTTINMGYTDYEITHIANISKPNYIFSSPTAYKKHEKSFKSLDFVKHIIVFGEDVFPGVILFNNLINIENVKYQEFQPVDVIGQTDTLFVLYSSGTTGLPKGVMLTHLNILIACNERGLNISGTPSTYLIITPWFHSMGFIGTLAFIAFGRNMVYLSKFEIDFYLDTIEKYNINCLHAVPPILVALTKHQSHHDLTPIELIYSAAAPLRKDTMTAIQEKFPTSEIIQGYGLTETSIAVTHDTYKDFAPKLGGVGRILRGSIMKVVDLETRSPLGANQPGEICVKGGIVMKGYVGKDRSEDFDEEGFFRTGDIGYYDDDGYFFIVDRLKELIKNRGYQVAPAEIEAVLLQHPKVRDAGVVGVEHPSYGEEPLAFVVLQPGATITAGEVQNFVAERLSNPKHLRGGVRFVPEIPKNPSGKILRRQLRAMLKDSKSKL